jgi:hypothetical protein
MSAVTTPPGADDDAPRPPPAELIEVNEVAALLGSPLAACGACRTPVCPRSRAP